MALVLGNTQTTSFTSASSLVITKPTGLAVGNLMIAFGNSFGSDLTTPSGWTSVGYDTISTLSSHVYWKIANASDVAASNFTFPRDSGTGTVAGAITAIPGALFETISTGDRGTGSGDDNVTFSGLTQSVADSMLMIMTCFENGSNRGDVSGYSVANNDPTWAETYDINDGGTNRRILAMASGTRAVAGATGTVAFLLNNLNATGFGVSHMVSLTEIIDASVSPATINLLANLSTDYSIGQGVLGTSLDLTASIGVGTASSSNGIWTNDNPSATPTWVNDTQS